MTAFVDLQFDITHLPALVVVGLAVFFGTIGARLFQRLRIPQVVGYIVIGLVVGETGLKLITAETVRSLEPFNYFALGVIGFMIGGELHRDVFARYGRQFFVVLLTEGMGAFFIVGLLVGSITLLITGNAPLSIALGLVLGAISSATAPAATVNVLWEYKTRGPLTTSVFAIVALDDALALVLYSIAASAAGSLTGHEAGSLAASIARVAWELLGGAALGVLAGLGLNFALRRSRDHENALAFIVGALALTIGLGRMLQFDTILGAMTLGLTISNLAPRRSSRAFSIVERFAPPIFVLFFVSVGAQLNLHGMPLWMWALAVPYVLGRTAGKMAGAWWGARLVKAAPVIRKYLGLCLFSQAGVAVGLSITASHRFAGEIGQAVIMIIALTTFLVQIIGPPCVKLAVQKAGEVGLNVTEEDLALSYTVGDMVNRNASRFAEGTPLANILATIARTEETAYGVVDDAGKLCGVITLQTLKQSFAAAGLTDWLVAFDLMQPAPDTIALDAPLQEAITRMKEQDLEYLPVVTRQKDHELVGMLEMRAVSRSLSQEIVRRRGLAGE